MADNDHGFVADRDNAQLNTMADAWIVFSRIYLSSHSDEVRKQMRGAFYIGAHAFRVMVEKRIAERRDMGELLIEVDRMLEEIGFEQH